MHHLIIISASLVFTSALFFHSSEKPNSTRDSTSITVDKSYQAVQPRMTLIKPLWIDSIDHRIASLDKQIYRLSVKQRQFNDKYLKDKTNQATKAKAQQAKHDPSFWETLYSVESKQGKMLYRPRNRRKNCRFTSAACGHHQLTAKALKDIGCKTKQCKADREDFTKSLAMSKKLQALNEKRLVKSKIKNLPEYQRYLIHQQGASGLKAIIAASRNNKRLPNRIKRNMASNSPYSFRSLKKMSSKRAAKKFMQHWKKKWEQEKELIKVAQLDLKDLPTFNENELKIALNLHY